MATKNPANKDISLYQELILEYTEVAPEVISEAIRLAGKLAKSVEDGAVDWDVNDQYCKLFAILGGSAGQDDANKLASDIEARFGLTRGSISG